MITDTEHAIFVRQEYRYATAIDNAVKAVNPMARDISINTQLSAASAQTLANNYLAYNANPRVFDVEIEGLLDLSSFIGGPPSFIANFPKYHLDGRTLTVVSSSADYNTGTTLIQVRG